MTFTNQHSCSSPLSVGLNLNPDADLNRYPLGDNGEKARDAATFLGWGAEEQRSHQCRWPAHAPSTQSPTPHHHNCGRAWGTTLLQSLHALPCPGVLPKRLPPSPEL